MNPIIYGILGAGFVCLVLCAVAIEQRQYGDANYWSAASVVCSLVSFAISRFQKDDPKNHKSQ